MTQQPTLTTERLILRSFSLHDADEIQRLAGDMAIAKTTLNIPHPYEDGMAEEWIATHQEHFERGKQVTFAITRKHDGKLIGAISLMDIAADHQAELGYWIGVPHWNCGYCSEAGNALLRYTFNELALVRVHARHLTCNPTSGRVMQKLGTQHEGTRRRHVCKWSMLEDIEQYGILVDEWG